MRVVYLSKVNVSARLPAVAFSLFNAHALAQAGADAFLLAQEGPSQADPASLLAANGLQDLDNFHLSLFDQLKLPGVSSNQLFYAWALKRILGAHKLRKIDACISRDPGALPYLAYLTAGYGIATFYQPHNFYVDLRIRPDVARTNRWKYHFLERTFIRRITGLLCLQEPQADLFRRYFPNKPVLATPPGLRSLQFVEPRKLFENRSVIYVGSFQAKKGVEMLVRAVASLNHSEIRLKLIGGRSEAEMAYLRALVAESDLFSVTETRAWLDHGRLGGEMAGASVGVLPLSDSFYNRYLTAPSKLFDYLSSGLPIIASDLPSIRAFLRHGRGCLLVPPGNVQALAAAMGRLLGSWELFEQQARLARRAAVSYQWRAQAGRMLEAMERTARTREYP